jgi:hypothetical protein
MDRDIWRVWLMLVAAGVGVFGSAMVITPTVPERLFTWMLFGDGFPAAFGDAEVEYVRFVAGVLGAVMVGWAVLILFVAAFPLRRNERWAWEAVVASLAVWYVMDSALSVATGYGENALLNTVIVLAFLPGLLGTRPRATGIDVP